MTAWARNYPRIAKFLQVVVKSGIGLFAIVGATATLTGNLDSLWQSAKSAIYPNPSTFSYQGQDIHYEGGSGITPDNPVIIVGAVSSDAGLAAMDNWRKAFYPDHEYLEAKLLYLNGRHLSMETIKSRYGIKRNIYFDNTQWYGAPSSNAGQQECIERLLGEISRFQGPSSNFKLLVDQDGTLCKLERKDGPANYAK